MTHYDEPLSVEDRLAVDEATSEADDQSIKYLPFYDRLRSRMHARVAGRSGGKVRREAAEVLLLVPDIFMLLVRLVIDPETPASTRGVLGGALAY
ncbi:MAG: hypothetical protein K8H90_03070, partial [Thermoanaerobaculia bacterium]|nr:hypothetical protein [Thermoanaerobaculia bacterium]